MINLITSFLRKLFNGEFYKDDFVKVDPQHERDADARNGPINW